MASVILHFYKSPGDEATLQLLKRLQERYPFIDQLLTEDCFNVEIKNMNQFESTEREKLIWLLSETFQPDNLQLETRFKSETLSSQERVIEVGPRLAFSTAWSSNCLSMCQACGIETIQRIEKSRRYLIRFSDEIKSRSSSSSEEEERAREKKMMEELQSLLHDRMTECVYLTSLESFQNGTLAEPVKYIQVMEHGRQALEAINNEKGLGFDDWDLDYYTNLFREKLCRNPSDVEVTPYLSLSLPLSPSVSFSLITVSFSLSLSLSLFSALIWPNRIVSTLAIGSSEGK
jgi:phosphoribosylformylglycinamidine synthase